jgi:hypothetical protein
MEKGLAHRSFQSTSAQALYRALIASTDATTAAAITMQTARIVMNYLSTTRGNIPGALLVGSSVIDSNLPSSSRKLSPFSCSHGRSSGARECLGLFAPTSSTAEGGIRV